MIDVIILTYNEAKHISRAIKSFRGLDVSFHVVDSFSTDETVNIARSLGANVIQNKWPGNHAEQFNFALNNITFKNDWVMKLDADEYLLPSLRDELSSSLLRVESSVHGIYLKRRLVFHGRWIRYGGYYPTTQLRIWRKGSAIMESRIMDEHIKLLCGDTVIFKNDFVDENLNGMSCWISKHNDYSSKEAAITISKQNTDSSVSLSELIGHQVARKKLLRQTYGLLPLFVRPIFYFFWRYIIRLGFLDGVPGLQWHFLQGCWYRFLVDSKVREYKQYTYDNAEIDNLISKIEKTNKRDDNVFK